MFQGASALNIDAKGRMSVPARHRDALLLQGEGRVTLTKHPDGCLLLFPRPEWEAFRARVAQLPMDAHWWRRIFLGNAAEIDLDGAGRVLITPELRTAANIEREIMLLGMGSHLEIWDANTYAAKEQAAIAQGMPDALKQFTF
ncbi:MULTISPECIES: division/cell wall cluster transcriptional repressor MraZ [unclassified Polynucleobacter]|uniref:division/cell wall cluster transcriptional repressor MraZ n=1 Tax=unclassified Polynucleobacter TaxID=2640945 RepID=UPI002573F037|nr:MULTISPECIES: division/cell wall cluster transcriptional repressor MraZ [unclassified Polynucleobacter]BEI34631.1 division/cell wall cluster transcriptional repressor MraZ [Polynucleobacter sp. HIN6]BEI36426.1 division/cell wall cluster transcriptional repressor MraZ [Polynucleobacter sp. HIN7]BEI40217.1 division/cell wall cluster transcriptional repressor MraZ [Polynucleobacter sp. HIN9]BEI41999.1 division/cell wall cluster transcriptional repressor MraZ [Polynucleobacter sp. HIN10]BEI4377